MSIPYRRFILDSATINRDGKTFLQTSINFPLLGFNEPRHIIHIVELPANTADEKAASSQEGVVQARLAIDRVLNSGPTFSYSHERVDSNAIRPYRGLFTLTVLLNGEDFSHTWKTPETYDFADKAEAGAIALATAFKKAAGWD